MVEIHVSRQRELFLAHEELLCHRVDYFRAAFQGNFIEGIKDGIEKEMELPEDDPDAFSHVLAWVYGNAPSCRKGHDHSTDDGHLLEWCKAYVLADKIGIEHLAGLLLEGVEECLDDAEPAWPDTERLAYVYKNTSENSPLRETLVKVVAKDFLKLRPQTFRVEHLTKRIRVNSAFQEEVMKYIWTQGVSEKKLCHIARCVMHSEKNEKK
jgi:hypothetical protein